MLFVLFHSFFLYELLIVSIHLFKYHIDLIEDNGVPRFAIYIQDHMVLQRASQIAVVWEI